MNLLLAPFGYLAKLETGKLILWCYLIWCLVTLCFYFDPSPAIWLNSIGISAIIASHDMARRATDALSHQHLHAALIAIGQPIKEPEQRLARICDLPLTG